MDFILIYINIYIYMYIYKCIYTYIYILYSKFVVRPFMDFVLIIGATKSKMGAPVHKGCAAFSLFFLTVFFPCACPQVHLLFKSSGPMSKVLSRCVVFLFFSFFLFSFFSVLLVTVCSVSTVLRTKNSPLYSTQTKTRCPMLLRG